LINEMESVVLGLEPVVGRKKKGGIRITYTVFSSGQELEQKNKTEEGSTILWDRYLAPSSRLEGDERRKFYQREEH